MVTPDSTHDNFSELGLSADPAAMGHGLKLAPAATADVSPAGPYGEAEQQETAARKVVPELGKVVPPSLQHLGPLQPHQQQSSNLTSGALASPRSMQDGRSMNSRPGQPTSVASTPGHMQLVVPPGEERSWYGTAWARLKHAVLGSAAAPDLLELGPPWTKWPDYGRANNINALVRALWPSLSNAVEEQLVMQMVPALLSDAAKTYGAGYIKNLELSQFDLGSIPPRLDGFKVYEESDDEQLMLEVAAAWGSLAKVTVCATLQLFGHTFQLPLTVQNIQFQALMRVTARPLMTFMPYVGSVGLSLLEPPHVDFELPVGALDGLDLMALPFVRGAFRLGARLAARQFAVYPKGIQVPLVEGGGAASVPCGVLELTLVKLKGLRSEDLIGQSDPYVKIRLREGRELRSKTINNNNEPVFNQTFSLVVDDPDKQVLQLIVYDEDLRGLKDKIIGIAHMPLKQSAALAMPKTRVAVSLEIQKIMAPTGTGGMFELPVRVAGLPITAAATGGRWLYKNVEGALGRGGGAGASGAELPSKTGSSIKLVELVVAKAVVVLLLKRISRGIAFLELTYTPIRQPAGEPSGAGGAPAPGVQAAVASGGVPVSPLDKGILAVTLVRAKGLTGWQGEADPYVTLTLLESGGGTGSNTGAATGSGNSSGVRQVHRSREPYRSNTIFNEDSPRWNEKFDFVMIPANSVLLATVWDQTSWVEAATSLKISTERFKDQVLGRVKVPVMDVAAAGRIRNSWPLQGALMGELEMVLQWVPAHLMD
eukprot:gene4857-5102_t